MFDENWFWNIDKCNFTNFGFVKLCSLFIVKKYGSSSQGIFALKKTHGLIFLVLPQHKMRNAMSYSSVDKKLLYDIHTDNVKIITSHWIFGK